jgi:hypothetical protein
MNVDGRRTTFAQGLVQPGLVSCLQGLIHDRVVEIWGEATALHRELFATAAEIRSTGSQSDGAVDLLLCLDTERTAEFLSSPVPAAALAADAIVVLWSAVSDVVDLSAAHSAHYLQQAMTGVLVRDAQFAHSQVAVLHEAGEDASVALRLSLWSNEPIPALQTGFFESSAFPSAPKPFTALAAETCPTEERAVALAKRLLDVEDRTLSLRGEIRRLTQVISDQGGGAQPSSWFDAPRTRHEWPLAKQDRPSASFSPYDARPDDPVIAQAKLGVDFFAAHGLDGETPDFAAAVAAINALGRVMRIDSDKPDVSIIIPVYGQLPYTLTCIHSLLLHESRYSAEIIVIDDCSPDGVTAELIPQVNNITYHRQPKNGGFIISCNTGGEIAKGKYIMMLNNDTRVVSGWLDNIIYSFNLFPRAGLVGSKMLYPDGRGLSR